MSWLELPDGSRMEVFGSGGAAQVASTLSARLGYEINVLGEIPLEERVRLGEITDSRRAVADVGSGLDDRLEDGLTGLLRRDQFIRALDEELAFAEWSNNHLAVARYHIRSPNRHVSDRP